MNDERFPDPRPRAPSPSQWNVLDAVGDGIYCVDAAGRCTFVNRAAFAMLRFGSAEEVLGRNMHELIHHTRPDGSHYPVEGCPLLQTLTSGRPVRLDNELLWRRDGTSFFAVYSSYPIAGEEGDPASVITFDDLSARRGAQGRLAVQHAVSQVLASPAELDTMQGQLLAAIGSGFGWQTGALWLPDGGSPAEPPCGTPPTPPFRPTAGGTGSAARTCPSAPSRRMPRSWHPRRGPRSPSRRGTAAGPLASCASSAPGRSSSTTGCRTCSRRSAGRWASSSSAAKLRTACATARSPRPPSWTRRSTASS